MRVVVTTVVATLLIAAAAPASPNWAAPGVRSAPLIQVARPGPIDGAPALEEPGLDRGESARLLRRLQELLREVGIYDGTADGPRSRPGSSRAGAPSTEPVRAAWNSAGGADRTPGAARCGLAGAAAAAIKRLATTVVTTTRMTLPVHGGLKAV